jgi:site-specific DNA recombinase
MEVVDEEVVRTFLARLRALQPGDPLFEGMAERWLSLTLPEREANRKVLEIKWNETEAQLADLEQARFLRGEFSDAGGIERYTQLRSALIERHNDARDGLNELRPSAALDIGVLFETELRGPMRETISCGRKRDLLRLAIDRIYLWRGGRAPGPRPQSSPLLPRLATVWVGETDPYVGTFGERGL